MPMIKKQVPVRTMSERMAGAGGGWCECGGDWRINPAHRPQHSSLSPARAPRVASGGRIKHLLLTRGDIPLAGRNQTTAAVANEGGLGGERVQSALLRPKILQPQHGKVDIQPHYCRRWHHRGWNCGWRRRLTGRTHLRWMCRTALRVRPRAMTAHGRCVVMDDTIFRRGLPTVALCVSHLDTPSCDDRAMNLSTARVALDDKRTLLCHGVAASFAGSCLVGKQG